MILAVEKQRFVELKVAVCTSDNTGCINAITNKYDGMQWHEESLVAQADWNDLLKLAIYK